MHRSLSILLSACAACLMSACSVELPLPEAGTERKIALIGELTAGAPISIRAGQSTPFSKASEGHRLVSDLSVVMRDESGSVIPLQGAEDHLSFQLFTMPYTNTATVSPGGTYTIEGTHPQMGTVSATTAVPGPFTATLRASARVSYNGDSAVQLDIHISDPVAPSARYVVEAIRQGMFITGYFYFNGSEYSIVSSRYLYDSLKAEGVPLNERYDTTFTGNPTRQGLYHSDEASENPASANRLFKRIFLPGKSFAGTSHTTRVLIPRSAFAGQFNDQVRILVQVKSVAADYYEFLKDYEDYYPSAGLGGNSTPAKLQGNVLGGFGMIGGVFLQEFRIVL